jgi:hypothetical protein
MIILVSHGVLREKLPAQPEQPEPEPRMIDADEADRIARANGFQYAEQFVKCHRERTLTLDDQLQIALTHRQVNQLFAIRSVVVSHCGATLTPAKVDQIAAEIETEMFYGGLAWAFTEGGTNEGT